MGANGLLVCGVVEPLTPLAFLSRPADSSAEDDFFDIARPDRQRRLASTLRRLAALKAIWADKTRFDAIVATGRYVKLSDATQCAEEAVERAWTGVERPDEGIQTRRWLA